jgi:hypothetical protein
VEVSRSSIGRSGLRYNQPFQNNLAVKITLAGQTTLDQPPGPNTYPPTATLASTLNLAPSVLPNIANPNAPHAQSICPGYKAANVVTSDNTITADLSLAGPACSAYGNDIPNLILEAQHQNAAQLNVKIYPKYIAPSNRSLYILDESLSPSGRISDGRTATASNLAFEWTNEPTFQFRVKRAKTGESLFDTYGHKIVFEDQFLELVTNMVPDYNIYGLPEAIRGSFRLPNQYTQTFWNQYNEMNDQPIDANMHSTHPVYLELAMATDLPSLTSCMVAIFMVRNGFCAQTASFTGRLAAASTSTSSLVLHLQRRWRSSSWALLAHLSCSLIGRLDSIKFVGVIRTGQFYRIS